MRYVFVITVLFMIVPARGATVGVSLPPHTVSIGDTFPVDVIGNDFPVTEGGGFSLAFDQTVINAISVGIDDQIWNFVNNPGAINNCAGILSDTLVSTFPGLSTGDFKIATIHFKAVGAGISGLILSESASNPWASGAHRINPFHVAGSVTVTATPVPDVVWLFATGLTGLVCVARNPRAGNPVAERVRMDTIRSL